jgi:hypothetical protein
MMGLPHIVLTPFIGAHDLLGISHRYRPVEALSECISDQGSRCGMVSIDLAVDILLGPLPQVNGDTAL